MGNELLEYGGIADILIKTKYKQTIGGETYAPGEPYTLLKDVNFNLAYESTESESHGAKAVMSARLGRPNSIHISGVQLNRKICDLILTQQGLVYTKTYTESVYCDDATRLMTSYTITNNQVYVYDSALNKVNVTPEIGGYHIEGTFTQGENYLVFYQIAASGLKYGFELPHYGYFQLEIYIKGNKEKVTSDSYMSFDAASLVSVPNFNMYREGILNTPMIFNFIYTNQEEPFICFDDV